MGEIGRKLLHTTGISVPFVAMEFGPGTVAGLATLLSAVYLFSLYNGLELFEPVKRDGLDLGPIKYGASVVVLLYLPTHPSLAYASIAVLALGDGAAGIAGRFGTHRLPRNEKTWEGSTGCFAAGLAGASLFVNALPAFAAALAGTAAEAYVPHDNLSVPFASYLSLLALTATAI